ncbi:hypothetical protein [Saccharopolyspora sp. NPDC050642]|uniref:hypothetical protein n=1 Tax=Saccharopolyspora sp. NPDC050642 TaxID=3157099 RepID=UPI0033E8FF1D
MMRKAGLSVVMLGALSLSFAGQVDAVMPLLGQQLGVVFAATNDVAALLALNVVLDAGVERRVRGWAWVVLFLSGGTGLVLNTWDALKAAMLPDPASILVGAQPVVLAWVLSHVVALVHAKRRQVGGERASQTTTEPPETPVEDTPEDAAGQPLPEAATSGPESVSGAGQPALPQSAETAASAEERPVREALPAVASEAADALPVDLIDRAERAERQALARSGGKRGLPFREAPRKLGVRYDTARAALEAARARMASETPAMADHAA